jgi:hypothetical protein
MGALDNIQVERSSSAPVLRTQGPERGIPLPRRQRELSGTFLPLTWDVGIYYDGFAQLHHRHTVGYEFSGRLSKGGF